MEHLFSWASCIYLLNKGLSEPKRQNIIFLMIFSSMQLSDAILGISKHEEKYSKLFNYISLNTNNFNTTIII